LAAADNKQERPEEATLESIRRISRDKFVLIYFAGPSLHIFAAAAAIHLAPQSRKREPFFVDKEERIELEA
jgi:hypothetical protein